MLTAWENLLGIAALGKELTEDPLEDTPELRMQAARVGGVLVTVGGMVAIIDALAPPLSPWILLLAALLATFLGMAMMLGLMDKARPMVVLSGVWALQVILASAYLINNNIENTLGTFFVWMVPYVAFFYGRKATIYLIIWVGALLIGVFYILQAPVAQELLNWISIIGLMSTVAFFVLWSTHKLRRAESEARYVALHDSLTQLGNRNLWAESVEKALEVSKVKKGRVIVLLVDLDEFKGVNDTFGHPAGDALLAQIAPRLVSVVRSDDIVTRLGGDEFAILCHDQKHILDAKALAKRLLEAVSVPYLLGDGQQAYTTASVGVVVAEGDKTTADTLLKNADVAMYEAKAAGRNRYMLFNEKMADDARYRHEIITALRTALSNKEMSLVYQPVWALDDLAVIGAETLLRWSHPTLGEVSPNLFIPIAEATGVINDITLFVLRGAARTMVKWRESGKVFDNSTMSVNVSVRDLRTGFCQKVLDTLEEVGLPASALAIEVTETALMDARADLNELEKLRTAGVWIVLDDFGSGYSSLAYLEKLPLDAIKLDREFLPDSDESRRWAVVGAVMEMARALGLHVIVEGVETQGQAQTLHKLGARWVQGYLYAHPSVEERVGDLYPEAKPLGPYPKELGLALAQVDHERGERAVPVESVDGGIEMLPVKSATKDN